MANLTSSSVRTIAAWVEGDVMSKRRIVKQVEVYSCTAGGATNKMVASAFGLDKIEETSIGFYKGNVGVVNTHPTDAGDAVYVFKAIDGATDPADIVLPASPNGLFLTVKGY